MESYAVDAPQDRAKSPSRLHKDAVPSIGVGIDSLTKMMTGGDKEFKNMYQTGGIKSNSNERKMAEDRVFGLDESTAPEDRPIYGYLRDTNSPDEAASLAMYGGGEGVQLDLRAPTKDERVFTTEGDSFGANSAEPLTPGIKGKKSSKGSDYRELQYFDHPTTDDIVGANVIAGKSDNNEDMDALYGVEAAKRADEVRALGIPTKHLTQVYQPSLFENDADPGLRGRNETRTLSAGLTQTATPEQHAESRRQAFLKAHPQTSAVAQNTNFTVTPYDPNTLLG
jgi:hypothetical protein